MTKATIRLIAWLTVLLFSIPVSAQKPEGQSKDEQTPIIVFVCEHGAARSIVAAAHFNKLAREQGLNFKAIARGTIPDKEVAPKVIEGLLGDELISTESAPTRISARDLVGARRVITFCALPDDYAKAVKVESWDGVPSMSENYARARDWLVERIGYLINDLKREK